MVVSGLYTTTQAMRCGMIETVGEHRDGIGTTGQAVWPDIFGNGTGSGRVNNPDE